MNVPVIALHAVDVVLSGRSILSGIDLHLSEKRIGVIGLNGSGKTTFARLLNGLQLPTEGTVLVDGRSTKKDKKEVQRRVGFVFQNPEHQIICPTVAEDLAFGLKGRGLCDNAQQAKIKALLKEHQFEQLYERSIYELSAGEKQMVALLGALVHAPPHLVLDEPGALLDWRQKERLLSILAKVEGQVIMVTHQLDMLDDFDRVIGFYRGQVVIDAPPALAKERYFKREQTSDV